MVKILVTVLAAAILAIALPARADLTWTDTRSIDQVLDNALLTGPAHWAQWTHTAAPETFAGSDGSTYGIAGATLRVYAEDVNRHEHVAVVYRDGDGVFHDLGKLKWLNPRDLRDGTTMTESTFVLDPAWLADGDFYAYIKGVKLDRADGLVRIDSSLLAVSYAPLPVPGALLMGTIGLGMVGYIKRRAGR